MKIMGPMTMIFIKGAAVTSIGPDHQGILYLPVATSHWLWRLAIGKREESRLGLSGTLDRIFKA